MSLNRLERDLATHPRWPPCRRAIQERRLHDLNAFFWLEYEDAGLDWASLCTQDELAAHPERPQRAYMRMVLLPVLLEVFGDVHVQFALHTFEIVSTHRVVWADAVTWQIVDAVYFQRSAIENSDLQDLQYMQTLASVDAAIQHLTFDYRARGETHPYTALEWFFRHQRLSNVSNVSLICVAIQDVKSLLELTSWPLVTLSIELKHGEESVLWPYSIPTHKHLEHLTLRVRACAQRTLDSIFGCVAFAGVQKLEVVLMRLKKNVGNVALLHSIQQGRLTSLREVSLSIEQQGQPHTLNAFGPLWSCVERATFKGFEIPEESLVCLLEDTPLLRHLSLTHANLQDHHVACIVEHVRTLTHLNLDNNLISVNGMLRVLDMQRLETFQAMGNLLDVPDLTTLCTIAATTDEREGAQFGALRAILHDCPAETLWKALTTFLNQVAYDDNFLARYLPYIEDSLKRLPDLARPMPESWMALINTPDAPSFISLSRDVTVHSSEALMSIFEYEHLSQIIGLRVHSDISKESKRRLIQGELLPRLKRLSLKNTATVSAILNHLMSLNECALAEVSLIDHNRNTQSVKTFLTHPFLQQLKVLHLEHNAVEHIEFLDKDRPFALEKFSCVASAGRIRRMPHSNIDFSALAHANTPNLKHLMLKSHKMDTLPKGMIMPSLVSLELHQSRQDEHPLECVKTWALPKLRELRLRGCHATFEDLETIVTTHPALSHLQLGQAISWPAQTSLFKTNAPQTLELSHNPLGDNILLHLAGCQWTTQGHHLKLNNTALNDIEALSAFAYSDTAQRMASISILGNYITQAEALNALLDEPIAEVVKVAIRKTTGALHNP